MAAKLVVPQFTTANLALTYMFDEGFHCECKMKRIAGSFGFHFVGGTLNIGDDQMVREMTFNGDEFCVLPMMRDQTRTTDTSQMSQALRMGFDLDGMHLFFSREVYEKQMTAIFRSALELCSLRVFLTDHRF